MKPTLRKDAHYDLQSKIYNAVRGEIEKNYVYRNCLSCINFKEKEEICILANQRPPARIIVAGCDMFEDRDEIPF